MVATNTPMSFIQLLVMNETDFTYSNQAVMKINKLKSIWKVSAVKWIDIRMFYSFYSVINRFNSEYSVQIKCRTILTSRTCAYRTNVIAVIEYATGPIDGND